MFYQIDTFEHLVTIDLVGQLTIQSAAELAQRVKDDPRYSPTMRVLYDLSRCDFSSISTAQMRRLTTLIEHETDTSRMAIYAPDNLAFGMARIYVSEASLVNERSRHVFKDYHSAVDWLSTAESD